MEERNEKVTDAKVMKEFMHTSAYKILVKKWNESRDRAMAAVLDLSVDKEKFPFEVRANHVNMINSWIDIPNSIIKQAESEQANKQQEELVEKTFADKTCLQRK